MTAGNSENAIKESAPNASQTQKLAFRRVRVRGGGGVATLIPHQGFALDPQGADAATCPLARFAPPPLPQHAKVWIRSTKWPVRHEKTQIRLRS